MKLKKGAYELILEGRVPNAVVRLSGENETPELSGEAEFYTTPLGVVICAALSGLPHEKRTETFGLCVGNEETPIYSSAGECWCAVMTGHLSVTEVIGKTMTVKRDCETPIACGTVRTPGGAVAF